MPAAQTPAPEPVVAPAPAPITASTPAPAMPWWLPQWPQVLGFGIYAMCFWLLWTLSPEKGKEPSQLFNMLAQAIVLTAFVNGVVAAVFTASRDSQKKNDVIATQAATIAAQTSPPQA